MFYKVLDSVKVIEYGQLVSGPFGAKILADLGAEVIKIEEPFINSNRPSCGSQIFPPVMSAGNRSGVNWTRP